MSCPTSLELSTAITAGGEADPVIVAHVAQCAECSTELDATIEAIALARELAAPLPSVVHRDRVRASLLAASRTADVLEPRPRSRAPYVLAGGALIAAAAALIITLGRQTKHDGDGHAHATVRPLPGASYLAVSSAPDELVVLYEGAIDVSVAPLHSRERFRVLVGGDEIEVHGTEFIATARAGTLVDVRVIHGIVEVRSRFAAATFLRAGETWSSHAAELTQHVAPSVAAPGPDPVPTASPTRPTRSPRAQTKPAISDAAQVAPVEHVAPRAADALPHEAAYDEGWTAMREGRFAAAATSFLRVQLLDPDGALAEDATYWHAVALARGRDRGAIDAFRELLTRYPTSRRAGEASAMLGWLLVDAGEPAEAKRRFSAALDDGNPAVRESARSGLDALAKQ